MGFIDALPLLAGFAALLVGCLALARWNRRRGRSRSHWPAVPPTRSRTSRSSSRRRRVQRRTADLFTHWPIYAVAVVGPLGFVLNQNAFQAGALPPVLAIITITDTIGAIRLRWLFLNEKLSGGPAEIAGQAVSLLVMTVGIVVLAHRSPQAAAARAQAAGTQDQAAATRDQAAGARTGPPRRKTRPATADQADGEHGAR